MSEIFYKASGNGDFLRAIFIAQQECPSLPVVNSGVKSSEFVKKHNIPCEKNEYVCFFPRLLEDNELKALSRQGLYLEKIEF
ncbi:MAG: hypothetical protein DRP16_01885 [Candidatus Aenigmatarchaeota archaeon]|nr:MAG: hypothetical protein DRP16_01885 [Candidatus Aenigmarchaeota archaeon]